MKWWPEIKTDESLPVDTFQMRHPDGRIDSFMLIDGELLPIHLTKLDDPPNWSCPICAFVNAKSSDACECRGLSER